MARRLRQRTSNRFVAVIAVGVSALLLGLGTAAAATSSAQTSACGSPTKARTFVTVKFTVPFVHVCTRKPHEAPGVIMITPLASISKTVGEHGALMLDQGGHPVWFHPAPTGQLVADLQPDTFKGQRVVSFWQGKFALGPSTKAPPGAPLSGAIYVYSEHYKLVKTIKAQGKGWITDFHDLTITPPSKTYSQGTALFLAAKKVSGFEDQEIQEINLANGKLVWSWDVHSHIPTSASQVKRPSSGVWDPYHANSIDVKPAGGLPDGKVLLSLRNTWGIYEISRATNKIEWSVVNGKHSTYTLPKNAKFYWQHDARFVGQNQISMFDDACCNQQPFGGHFGPARGLLLTLKGKSASVARQYHHPNTSLIVTQGSYRVLPDGHAFIGWGRSPYFSEYTATGTLLYDAALPSADVTYRALKSPWVGLPTTKPSVAVRRVNGHVVVYASWNGSTTVAKWKVLAGKSAGSVNKAAGLVSRSGFETFVQASNSGPYFKVEALDSHGHVLGTSKVVKLS